MQIQYDGEWSVKHEGEEITGITDISIDFDAGNSSSPRIEIGLLSMDRLRLDVDPSLIKFAEDRRFHGSIASVCDGCTGMVAQDIGITEDGNCTECGEKLVSKDYPIPF